MLRSHLTVGVPKILRRNIGIAAPVLQKATDPIQQLFIDKIREYKSKSASGKLELSPEIEKERKSELERISQQFGINPGTDATQFPQFKFTEPKVDPINLEKQ